MKLIKLKPIDNRKYEVVLNVEIPSNINVSVDVFVINELRKMFITENNDDNLDKINKLSDEISTLNTTVQNVISGVNTELTKIKEDVKSLKNEIKALKNTAKT